eukprot:TRINITY_DN941_c0_g1_i1.p1 TRINITY_DN941_c0_g1~~TRINITY_DN941_c0_g1_i1.p1  ORF type:complete len:1032 (-),score=219.18 TRINITY_DN941_c0_g1_i1:2873-5968(-)
MENVGRTLLSEEEGFAIFEYHFTETSIGILLVFVFILLTILLKFLIENFEITFFPETGLIVVLGFVAGIFVVYTGTEETFASITEFNTDLFFLLLLPPIIFESGYYLESQLFADNVGTICLYAIIGTLLNSVIIGLLLFGLEPFFSTEFTFLEIFTFASLISAVDPVAVLAVFQETAVNPTLNMLVFGESVLNDAVSIVLYSVFSSLLGTEVPDAIWGLGILKFTVVAVGGLLVGVLFGLLTSFITKYTSHIAAEEPFLILIMGILSFVIAEVLKLSGIVAILVCGMIQSHYADANINPRSRIATKFMIKTLSGTADSLIFLQLGINSVFLVSGKGTTATENIWDTNFILLTLLMILPVRFFIVFFLTFLANTQRMNKIKMRDQFIMGYGGLRGAIAFALAVLIPSYVESKGVMLTCTMVVILWTVFVQGGTIKLLIKWMRIELAEQDNEMEIGSDVLRYPLSKMTDAIKTISGGSFGIFGWRHFWRDIDHRLSSWFVRDLWIEEKKLIDVMAKIKKDQIKGLLIQEDMNEMYKLSQNQNVNLNRVFAHAPGNYYREHDVRNTRETRDKHDETISHYMGDKKKYNFTSSYTTSYTYTTSSSSFSRTPSPVRRYKKYRNRKKPKRRSYSSSFTSSSSDSRYRRKRRRSSSSSSDPRYRRRHRRRRYTPSYSSSSSLYSYTSSYTSSYTTSSYSSLSESLSDEYDKPVELLVYNKKVDKSSGVSLSTESSAITGSGTFITPRGEPDDTLIKKSKRRSKKGNRDDSESSKHRRKRRITVTERDESGEEHKLSPTKSPRAKTSVVPDNSTSEEISEVTKEESGEETLVPGLGVGNITPRGEPDDTHIKKSKRRSRRRNKDDSESSKHRRKRRITVTERDESGEEHKKSPRRKRSRSHRNTPDDKKESGKLTKNLSTSSKEEEAPRERKQTRRRRESEKPKSIKDRKRKSSRKHEDSPKQGRKRTEDARKGRPRRNTLSEPQPTGPAKRSGITESRKRKPIKPPKQKGIKQSRLRSGSRRIPIRPKQQPKQSSSSS